MYLRRIGSVAARAVVSSRAEPAVQNIECSGLLLGSQRAPLDAWPWSLGSRSKPGSSHPADVRQSRMFRSARLCWGGVEVEIQSMGESITEGSIAEVLKQQGDAVEEDEVIAQIETDKVTIDIKAPVAGKIEELRVKADDTVKVGQVVAVIAEGEGGESSATGSGDTEKPEPAEDRSAPEPAPESSESESTSAKESPEEPGGQAEPPARQPSIRFPPRMTPDGRRIADLSSEERERFQRDSQEETPQASQSPSASKPAPEQPQRGMPWYVGKEQGTKLSQSRVLSQREMDQIELGGADP